MATVGMKGCAEIQCKGNGTGFNPSAENVMCSRLRGASSAAGRAPLTQTGLEPTWSSAGLGQVSGGGVFARWHPRASVSLGLDSEQIF